MTDNHKEDVGVLDVVVFFAENWIAIFLAPALVAAVVFYLSSQAGQDVTASTSVELPQTTTIETTSPMSRAVSRVSLVADIQAARQDISISRDGRIIFIAATAGSAGEAVGLVRSTERALSEEAIASVKGDQDRIALIGEHVDYLNGLIASGDAAAWDAETLSTVTNLWRDLETDAASIDAVMTWAEQPVDIHTSEGRSPSVLAFMALVIAAMLATGVCVAVGGFRAARATPEGRKKIDRIRAAFWLRGKNNTTS